MQLGIANLDCPVSREAHAYNPSTWEVETGGSGVKGFSLTT